MAHLPQNHNRQALMYGRSAIQNSETGKAVSQKTSGIDKVVLLLPLMVFWLRGLRCSPNKKQRKAFQGIA